MYQRARVSMRMLLKMYILVMKISSIFEFYKDKRCI